MKEKKEKRVKPRIKKKMREKLWHGDHNFLREKGRGEIIPFLKDFGEKKHPCCAC